MKLFSAQLLKTKKTSFQKGFTLIELLVVIGILGILAAALIATIDPFEQLKKATDARVENTSVEFLNSNIRYYTTHNTFPWESTDVSDCYSADDNPAGQTLASGLATCISNNLIGDGELKPSFTTATAAISAIYVTENANNVTVCYRPTSKSKQRDPNTRFSSTGGAGTSCGTNVSTCFWCTQ